MTIPPALVATLQHLVGARHVLTRGPALLAYESDALPGYRQRPALAVMPGTRDELIAVIRALAAHDTAFVARGAGTGLSGGALADGVVLVGLHRLKRILAVDPIARTATVEPGVVNATLTAAVAALGLHYAPDPSSQTACTIGGNVAENAGGPHCLKYGVTLNHIVAATVVLPDGQVTTLHAPTRADDGPDLLGAFIGSEGCFGIAVEITVRLTPDPEAVRTLLADFFSVDDAAQCTTAIIAAGIVPAACELMDQPTIQAVEASIYAAGYPTDAAAVLLVEVDGSAGGVPEDAAHIEQLCLAHGARRVRSATDAADRARLWQGRKKAFGAMGRVAPHLVVQDAVVPRSQLAPILREIRNIGDRYGLTVCNVFHAGDGNLHPNIPYDANDSDAADRVHHAMSEIMACCIAAGGTISGEHGVGLDKLGYMEQLFSGDTLDAMCRLRGAFDPARRANPGKVVPVHSCREWLGVTHRGHPAPTPPPPRGPSVDESPTGIMAYVPADLTITVGADTTLRTLDAVTATHAQWCPLLPWGDDGLTIGEVLSRGLRGPASPTLGAARDLVLGVSLTDRRGARIAAGGRVVKNVAGFDLTRLVIGAGGALGTIHSATLRLRARPNVLETWAIASDECAVERFDAIARGSLAPIAVVRIPAALAAALGLRPIAHHITWIGGNRGHTNAARAAVLACGPATQLPEHVWPTIRAHGPFADAAATPTDPIRDALRARVVAAFTSPSDHADA